MRTKPLALTEIFIAIIVLFFGYFLKDIKNKQVLLYTQKQEEYPKTLNPL